MIGSRVWAGRPMHPTPAGTFVSVKLGHHSGSERHGQGREEADKEIFWGWGRSGGRQRVGRGVRI